MEPAAATPLEVDALLERVLQRPETEWALALDELCASHPQAAMSLRRRFALLAESGLVGAVPRPEFLSPGHHFASYHLLELLGAGGMGVVFRARKEGAADDVALKVLRPELLEHPTARSRFLREAASLADLVHPAVCALVDFGEHAGVPFLAMKLLRGRTLAAAVAEARRLARPGVVVGDDGGGPAWQTVVQLFATLARGLAAVHARGLVHRDIKPENIFVERGAPVLIDFGLAAAADATRLTRSGEPLGTPAYMAPEQVRGGDVDARSDVYGLAASLYECVALRPPFLIAAREALYRAILTEDAPDVRAANPELPRSLALVLGKALQKEPSARYATALAFAEELERVATGKPPKARPVPIWRQAWRWARAHPKPTLSGVAVALVLGLGAIELQLAERSARIASEGLAASAGALLQRDVTVGALVAREAWRQLPDSETTRSNLLLALSRNLQVGEFEIGAPVLDYLPSPDGTVAIVLSDRVWLRQGSSLRELPATVLRAPSQYNSGAWARDGQSFLVASAGGVLHRFARDGAQLPLAEARFAGAAYVAEASVLGTQVVCSRADGSFVVGDKEGGLRTIGADGATVDSWRSNVRRSVVFVGAMPEGASFVTVDRGGEVLQWDQPGGTPVVLHPSVTRVTAVCGSMDCRQVVLGDAQGEVHVVDVVAGEVRATLGFGVQKPIQAVALSPDGDMLVASAIGQRWAMWRLSPQPRLVIQERTLALVNCVTFTPSGREVALTDVGGRLSIYDLQGRRQVELAAHRFNTNTFVARSTGSGTLVTGEWGTGIREWRLDAPGLSVLRAHEYPAMTCEWLPDGRSIVSSGADGRLVWTSTDGTRWDAYRYPEPWWRLKCCSLSPDATQIVCAEDIDHFSSRAHRLRLDHQARRFVKEEPEFGKFSPNAVWRDEHTVILVGGDGDMRAYDVRSGAPVLEWKMPDGTPARAVKLAGHRGRLVTVSWNGVRLWRDDGSFERNLLFDPSGTMAVDFAPDGASVLVGLARGGVVSLDLQGNTLREYRGGLCQVWGVRFSPDGRFAGAVGNDGYLLVWETGGDGTPWLRLPHKGALYGLAFSPDSEQVAVACSDGAIHIWPVSERRIAALADTIFRDLTPSERASLLRR